MKLLKDKPFTLNLIQIINPSQFNLSFIGLSNYKDQITYGVAYLFWGIIAFVEIEAYDSTLSLTISQFLITSLLTIFNDWRYGALTVVEFIKMWVAFQTLKDTTSLASWFFMSQADVFLIYLYNFTQQSSSRENEEKEKQQMEITQQKFIGLSLWIIGYFLELIFGGAVRFTLLIIIVYATSLAETIIMRYQRPEDKLSKMTSFNFDDPEIKLNYAKAKLVISSAVGLVYALISGLMYLVRKSDEPFVQDNLSKSFVLFIILALLTLLRDKYEKQINKKHQESNNLIGRAIFLPLIFLCFSVFMLNKLSAFHFFLHILFLTSYIYFFWEDIKSIIGFDINSSVKSQLNKDNLIYDFVITCYENNDSRKIAIFFLINLIFMFVELVYGYISNSLGLITDSFHMLFDCMALFIGLCASYISKMGVDKKYTYGYGRVETLSGLFNGIFLVFIAFNVFCESIERIYEPQMIETDGLLTVSTLGFCVNLVGLFFFHDHHDHGHDHGHGHDHDHENENMYGVFLHVLADTLGSVGVIFSSILVKYYQIYVADPICSFIISLMILASGIPFIQMTASNLILKTPLAIKKKRAKVEEMISKLEGVKEVRELLIWEMAKKKYVATVDILVTQSANRSMIHDEVSTILRGIKCKDITVQMTGPNVPQIHSHSHNHKHETHTEDDIHSHSSTRSHDHVHEVHLHGTTKTEHKNSHKSHNHSKHQENTPVHLHQDEQDNQLEYEDRNHSSLTEEHKIEQDLTTQHFVDESDDSKPLIEKVADQIKEQVSNQQSKKQKKNRNKNKGKNDDQDSKNSMTVSEQLGLNKNSDHTE